MRLFFALPLAQEARGAVVRVQNIVRADAGRYGIRWEEPDKFHYTLRFLGEVEEARLPQLTAIGHQVARDFAPFPLTLTGLGAFPNERRPQILWMGAQEGVPVLRRLVESIERAVVQQGFPTENQRFRPHLTLARVKSREGETRIAEILARPEKNWKNVDRITRFEVQQFVLIQSELHPTGSVYTTLETFPLTQETTV